MDGRGRNTPRPIDLTGRRESLMAKYAAALDQGTTSSRCMIFDHGGQVVSVAQKEHEQIYPKPGWVEHDANEIWARTQEVIDEAMDSAGASADDIAAVGITNQRETALVWDRNTGEPVMNAVVWQDTRTDKLVDEYARDGGQARFQEKVGLPLATYFSGPKVRWILDNVEGAADRAEAGDLVFGNMDTWLIWNLTGGTDGGLHITDPTNASRTMLMDLKTLDWDEEIMGIMGIPRSMLPEIKPSSAVYGDVTASGALQGVAIAGILGDQQAATFGQTCFSPGEAKNTYGTGNFLLLNTGNDLVQSKSGLLTTVGYKIGDQDPVYCLEGSIAITGALVQWLRDNLKLIKSAPEIEELASTVEDNGGAYFVPAFSGLFAPYWKSNARGVVAGLTRYVNGGHIARAALEAVAYQSREVVEAMNSDSGVALESLKVDGGMVGNDLLMQFQADVLNVPVIRPKVPETTSLGAAYAAGLATGFWAEIEDLRENWVEDKRWEPQMDEAKREELYKYWKRAVTRTFDWFEES
jgi:glycerol kinase